MRSLEVDVKNRRAIARLLRKESQTGGIAGALRNAAYEAYLDLSGKDGMIDNLQSSTRRLWYGAFDPGISKDKRLERSMAMRGLFGTFLESNFCRLTNAWNCDTSFDLLEPGTGRRHVDDSRVFYYPSLSRVPEGEHLVVPIMAGAVIPAMVVASHLSQRGGLLGFALVGYSSGAINDFVYRDGSRYSDIVRIGEPDLEIFDSNRDKSVLVLDDMWVSGGTMLAVQKNLSGLGIRKITSLSFWNPDPRRAPIDKYL